MSIQWHPDIPRALVLHAAARHGQSGWRLSRDIINQVAAVARLLEADTLLAVPEAGHTRAHQRVLRRLGFRDSGDTSVLDIT